MRYDPETCGAGKMKYPGITNRLSLRIILPVIALMLVMAAGFYLFLNQLASDVIKGETASSSLINEIRAAYAIMGILLLLASFLFIYYLEKTIQSPLSRMIERLKRGENTHYKGINEFEFLSDTIGNILDPCRMRPVNSTASIT
jgi:nitrate/nitrite-specific signal transduction histidine kinase